VNELWILMRQPTTKDLAKYFRFALEAGLCREEEIETWADKMIVEASSPTPEWLLNLSIERDTSKSKLLEAVPGEADKITAWSLLRSRLGVAKRTGQLSREHIVRALFRWAVNREIPDPFFRGAYRLDDSFDGTKEGWNSEEQFIKDFEDFFVPFRSFEMSLPQSIFQSPP
jgi:hypothetical protein